jgi:drug/metabolite transporter (DMT)-like permease
LLAWPSVSDAWLLAALAMGCTLFPFALSLVALRQISAFSASLAVNLEPIYAIVLAILLLGEQRELATSFYVGVAIILVVVFLHPLWSGRKKGSDEVMK